MIKSFVVCLIYFALVSTASAGSLTDQYRESTKKVLAALSNLGITKIACTRESAFTDCETPASLTKKIDQLKWVEFAYFIKGSAATRWDAFNSPQEQTIYLNKSTAPEPSIMGYIGLHEVLGALGRSEPDFNITLAAYYATTSFDQIPTEQESIWTLEVFKASIMIIPGARPHLEDDQRLWVRSNNNGGGGVFVGGGGGDARTFYLRAQVFKHLKKYVPRASAREVNFDSVRIEITNSTAPEIQYNIVGGFMLEQIFVPAHLLKQISLRDPKVSFAVEDISWFLASAYPDLAEVPVRGEIGFYEPLSLKGFHPVAIRDIWCGWNIFRRGPISACQGLDL